MGVQQYVRFLKTEGRAFSLFTSIIILSIMYNVLL